jgi:NitT/TauT family transport system substrate-binding protein
MIHRRALLAVALGASLVPWSGPARAEVSEVHIVRQFGIGYLPLTIMLHEKLVEKHAAKPASQT